MAGSSFPTDSDPGRFDPAGYSPRLDRRVGRMVEPNCTPQTLGRGGGSGLGGRRIGVGGASGRFGGAGLAAGAGGGEATTTSSVSVERIGWVGRWLSIRWKSRGHDSAII